MVTRARRVVIVTLLALGTVVPAGPALAQSSAPANGGPSLEGTDWQLTTLTGTADQSVVPGMGATLALSVGQASGFGGCNQFTTSYVLDGQSLTFETPASTRMACDDAKMSFESVYLGALPTVASYTIAGDTLTLADGTGAPALAFTAGTPAPGSAAPGSAAPGSAAPGTAVPASAAPGTAVPGMPSVLIGTWTVTQLNNGAQGVETVSDPALTVTFAADGSVSGFGGCNQFGGPFEVAGDSIALGPLHSTLMACGDPIDTTERQLLAALGASVVWSVRDATLELRDASGALQAGLAAGEPVGSPSPA